MFNNRRQSADQVVIEDLINIAGPDKIRIAPRSAGLFNGYENCISVSDRFLEQGSGICFAECGDLLKFRHCVNKLIVYKWNRLYPSDLKFPLEAFLADMTLESVTEIEGRSHSNITREVYIR